jgi:von Willebrand factor type A domain
MRYLWYSMYGFVTTLAVYAIFFRQPTTTQPTPEPSPLEPVAVTTVIEKPKADVQIALILDTSSSMDGLVEQARTQLWEMVADLQVDDDDKERTVAVALYQYGNNRLPLSEGFIQQLAPLTTDLDQVTVQLHALRTSGGKEYAPQAILRAAEELEWDDDDSVEKIIVIAGNEGFHQGRVRTKDALLVTNRKQITVLPIYCANQGASRTAVSSWRNASSLAGTDFESIDPDQQVAKIESPYDAEILRKYRQLEQTKVYAPGHQRSQYASQADGCVKGAVAIDRAVVQSRQDTSADLVTAYGSGRVSLDKAPMPKALAGKSQEQQKVYFQQKVSEQEALRDEIAELNEKRQSHIQQRMKEIPAYTPSNLGRSVKKGASKARQGNQTVKGY